MPKVLILTLCDKDKSDQFRGPEGSHGISLEVDEKALKLPADQFVRQYLAPAGASLLIEEKARNAKVS